MSKAKTLLFLIVLFFLSSCSLEKRHYMSGYNINWKFSKNNTTEKIIDNTTAENFQGTIDTIEDKQENYPLTTTTDSTPTFFKQKIETYYSLSTIANDTLKSKKEKKQKKEKIIDPQKDSKASLLLGVFAICLIVFGVALLFLVLSFSSFSYVLYMLAMLSLIASLIFGIIGLIKALKVLKYLKSNPEETKKNKRKTITGLIFSALALLPYILFLVYYISAIIIYNIR